MASDYRGLGLLARMVAEFDENGAQDLVRRRLAAGEDPMDLLDECRDGLKVVGGKYEEGKFYISALIMAGEVLRGVLDIIAPELARTDTGAARGTILIGTVQGDIHDVGKEIVIMLLRAHGIEVVDLGVNVAPSGFADAVADVKPDLLGLSCLLTDSFGSMQHTVAAVKERTAHGASPIPVIIGGSPMSQDVCDFVGADYWCTDAVEGSRLVRGILSLR